MPAILPAAASSSASARSCNGASGRTSAYLENQTTEPTTRDAANWDMNSSLAKQKVLNDRFVLLLRKLGRPYLRRSSGEQIHVAHAQKRRGDSGGDGDFFRHDHPFVRVPRALHSFVS
eukprot:m.185960 g.185960  ORF g.185960 m.185960 type:complete len:118 (-) comp15044_c0_seq1:591-944(-)